MKPPKSPDGTLAQLERLAFIEFRLWFLGDVRRPDLVDRFQISPAVSTRDISDYKKLEPQNIVFNDSKKQYEPTEEFSPIFQHDPERVLSALSRGFGEGFGKASSGFLTSEFPLRLNQPDLSVLAVVTRAIHQQKVVALTYFSQTSGRTKREICPFALIDSGQRWHARAFDRKSREFRDFAISRMEKPYLLDDEVQDHEQPEQDHQWSRMLTLELLPHPDHPRPEVVVRDFDMKQGKLTLNVRAAIVGYVLQHWGVDCSAKHTLNPSRYRLWLKDAPYVLHGVGSAVLADGYEDNMK